MDEAHSTSGPRHRDAAFAIQAVQALHLVLLYGSLYPVSSLVLILSGAISIVVYAGLIYLEVGRDELVLTPFLIYLALGILNVGVAPIYAAVALDKGLAQHLAFVGRDTSSQFVAAQFVNLLGDWFFVSGYLFGRLAFPKNRPVRILGGVSHIGLFRAGLTLALCVYFARVLVAAGIPLNRLGQPYNFVAGYGAAAALLILLFAVDRAPPARRLAYIGVFAAVIAFESYRALNAYMKIHAAICLIPIAVFVTIRYLRKTDGRVWRVDFRRTMGASIIAIASLLALFTYSQKRRSDFQLFSRSERPEIGRYMAETLASFDPTSVSSRRSHEFPHKGIWYFFHRHCYLPAVGWAYAYVADHGDSDGKQIREAPLALIPRLVWSSKPMISHGREIAVLLGQGDSVETVENAVGFSLSGCLYWAWGFPAVVIGMFLNGSLLCISWKVFRPMIGVNIAATIACMAIYVQCVRWFAGVFDANIVFYFLLLVCFLPLSLFLERHRLFVA